MGHFKATLEPRIALRATAEHVLGLEPPNFAKNMVIVLVDDMMVASYQTIHQHYAEDAPPGGPDPTGRVPYTPVIQALRDSGRLFSMTFAQALCSPTRANLLAGRYPFRTGVGDVVGRLNAGDLAEYNDPGYEAPQLGHILTQNGIRNCFAGKCHFSIPTSEQVAAGRYAGRSGVAWAIHQVLGWEWWGGPLRNLNQSDDINSSGDGTYYDYGYQMVGDTGPHRETTYATTKQRQDIQAFLRTVQPGERFCVYWPASVVHSPYGIDNFPPDNLVYSQVYKNARDAIVNEGATENAWPAANAGLEALDKELGILLDSMDTETRRTTTVVVMPDNGPEVGIPLHGIQFYGLSYGTEVEIQFGTDKWKGHPYRPGSNVPMIWCGPRRLAYTQKNQGSESNILLDGGVDLYATIIDYFGIPIPPTDGQTFLQEAFDGDGTIRTHTRKTSMSEIFNPNGIWQDATELERGFRAWIVNDDTHTWSIQGLFTLFTNLGEPDLVFRLLDENEQQDDWFENTDIKSDHDDVYRELLRLLNELLNSKLSSGDWLPVTLRDGSTAYIQANESGNIPITLRDGSAGELEVTDGLLPVTLRDGSIGYIALVDGSSSASWGLPVGTRGTLATYSGPVIPMNPDGTIDFTLRDGSIGKLQVDTGTTPPQLPVTLRDGSTGYIQLVEINT